MSNIQTGQEAGQGPHPSPKHSASQSGFFKSWWLPILLVICATAVTYTELAPAGAEGQLEVKLFEVTRAPLTISVTESGTLRSSVVEVLKNQFEGMTTVISIVEEGKVVTKGTVLIELDSSEYDDRLVNMQIQVQNAKAGLIKATEHVKIQKQEALSLVQSAEVRLKLAQLDLAKYESEGGVYQQEVERASALITTSKNNLTTAEDRLTWSKKLSRDGFITDQDLNKDELTEERTRLNLRTAENGLTLLKQYTRDRAIEQLTSDLNQAKFSLEKVKHSSQSGIVNAEADLFAKEAMFKRETEKLEKINRMIEACIIIAPVDGMVVYATSVGGGKGGKGGRGMDMQPLGEGSSVYPRQALIRLPATNGGMTVDVKIHEASLDKIAIGMPVRITTEALPGKTFNGRLETIGLMPDASAAFMNPDLKLYNSEITMTDNLDGLRPGMSCQAEILIDYFDDTVAVPVQAVLRQGNQHVVFIMKDDGQKEERTVEIGLDNNRMMQILSGLKGGEEILLAPPQTHATASRSAFGEINQELLEKARNAAKQAAIAAAAQPANGEGKKGPGGPGGGGMAARFDKNGDGKLSKDEFPNAEMFDKLDKDGDGFITASEIPTAPAGGRRGGGQGGGGGRGGQEGGGRGGPGGGGGAGGPGGGGRGGPGGGGGGFGPGG